MRSLILVSTLFIAACAHRKASEEPATRPVSEEATNTGPQAPHAEVTPEEPEPAQAEAAPAPTPELGSTKYCGKFTPPNTQTIDTAALRKKQQCAAAKASAQQEGMLDNRDETCQASLEGGQAVCVELRGKGWSLWDATYPALRKVAECRCAAK